MLLSNVSVCFVQTLQWLTPWRHEAVPIQQSFRIADTVIAILVYRSNLLLYC